MEEALATRTQEKMQEVLMDPSAPGPAVHYYMIRGGSKVGNITVWQPGTVGGEYIKAYGHYHRGDWVETYQVLSGEGLALLQKRVSKADPTIIEDFRVIKVKAGDTVEVPIRYGHLFVNTGTTYLVTNDDSPVVQADSADMPLHADYEPVKLMHGFAYYVVERNGAPALIKNPRYKDVQKTNFGGLPVVEA